MWSLSLPTRRRFHWFIDHAAANKDEGTPKQGRRLTYNAIESGGNEFLVWLVASIGFFTDSYILFASNAILPMLSFVYWPTVGGPAKEEVINIATLAGCIFGMLLFGVLGDKYGRRKMYGYELIVLIVGTVGVLMSSNGYAVPGITSSMNIESWLLFWRFVSGVGLGGDYPLSAVIVSEFGPKRKRARMLAGVFSMQALGILAASLVALVVVAVVQGQHMDQSNPDIFRRGVDQMWRWIMGLSLIPATFAIVIRLSIPESPRYTLDVSDNPFKALVEADRFNDSNLLQELDELANVNLVHAWARQKQTPDSSEQSQERPTRPHSQIDEDLLQFTWHDYFIKQGNWLILFGTASTWFLLDFAFFGLGLSSPKAISKIWYNGQTTLSPTAQLPTWDVTFSDYSHPDQEILNILQTSAWHSLIVVSIGAVLGSAALVLAIPHFNRKCLQWMMFLGLAALFLVTGGTYRIGNNGVTITLYLICQICFYFGPNGLTFIIPAELFPTKYRCTCHGISAASGKLGSIIVQVFLAYVEFGANGEKTLWLAPNTQWFGDVLLIFSAPMVFGAAISYFCIPDLQEGNGESLSLEDLSVGRRKGFSGGPA